MRETRRVMRRRYRRVRSTKMPSLQIASSRKFEFVAAVEVPEADAMMPRLRYRVSPITREPMSHAFADS